MRFELCFFDKWFIIFGQTKSTKNINYIICFVENIYFKNVTMVQLMRNYVNNGILCLMAYYVWIKFNYEILDNELLFNIFVTEHN